MTIVIDKEGNKFRMREGKDINFFAIKYVNCVIPEKFLNEHIDKSEVDKLLSEQCSKDSLKEVIILEDGYNIPRIRIEGAPIPENIIDEFNSKKNVKEILKERSNNHFNKKGKVDDNK